ncbi:hypothetical protein PybrP1_001391 [[Pythium] brassicae (nom. inval.)]|nr:hypothetical protein PybrP1_001391 [[Pythium] brassicae (nom. inval.)]
MAAADQNIAMMDGTYFVGRKEILDWVNGICATSLSKVEQTCTGAVACMILDSMYPGKVPMSKVDWGANKDYEYIQNYKVLQKCFTSLKLDKHIEVDRLVRGKYQDNLEFMQWFKKFYELNASGQPYDAVAQREKGKGGALYTSKFGGSGVAAAAAASPTPPAAAARRKPGATAPTGASARTAAAKPPGAPVASSISSARVGAAKSAVGASRRPVASAAVAPVAAVPVSNPELEREVEELTAANETLTNENGELRLAVEGLEKERDFYFGKLRDIEILLQATDGADASPLAQNIFKILYATEEEFAAGEGEPQDEDISDRSCDEKKTVMRDVSLKTKACAKDDDDGAAGSTSGKADSKDSGGGASDDLIGKVIAFFFDDDEFAQTFERFAESRCLSFDLDSDEMKLEYTAIYNEFVELFESKLEAYIVSQGSTTNEFYRLVRQAYANDRESSVVLCSEILVATADFDVFVLMMKQTKESLLLAKH